MQESKILSIPEWLFVVTFCFFLLFIALYSSKHKMRFLEDEIGEHISVRVVGAVKEETLLTLPFGATIADVVAKVRLTSEAARDKLVMRLPLKEKDIVVIPSKGVVTIYLQGAVVNQGVYHLPEGATYRQLVEKPIFLESADLRSFKRRKRLLKEGEVILVPSK